MGLFDLHEINRRAAEDPRSLLAECDSRLNERYAMAAAQIAANAASRRVILLAGPSGSGKTTSARKLAAVLTNIGVGAHVISMDDYYLTVTEETHVRDQHGNFDYETPDILDLPLMRTHFADLSNGREALIPRFDFPSQSRDLNGGVPLRLGMDEVAIFEGIHALNPGLLDGGANVTRLYVSARTDIKRDGGAFFKATWMRLLRRVIRDEKFRGAAADYTFGLWAGVRRGEKKYISPYKDLADIKIDTALPYEVCALKPFAEPLFYSVPEVERAAELRDIAAKLSDFSPIPDHMLCKTSLIREFIGGLIV